MLYALKNPNVMVAVITPTFGDLRRTAFEGVSGILKNIPDGCLLEGRGQGYNSSASEIRLYNGSKIMGFSATEPDRLRGPQFHRAWCDELAAWRYPEAFDQLMFALRLGEQPQCIITTTPKPTPMIKALLERPDTIVTSGSTFENEANLAGSTLAMLKTRYEGTSLGRQELYAEVIDNLEGALWNYPMIEKTRIDDPPDLQNLVIAVDPAVTSGADSDETGIVVVAKCGNGRYYVLEDRSGKYSPDQWGKVACDLFHKWDADRVIAEVNNGGDLVERLIKTVDHTVRFKSVHATRGKLVRAEPIAALYEQGKVHHVGVYPELESQMCTYTGDRPKPSPDRLDALVWGLSELSKSRGDVAWRIS
tara:strand:- start:64 stop:1152 length:1089 start_codon:yes stop_codon:yes gene_type:complete